jgi:hypothetical protein
LAKTYMFSLRPPFRVKGWCLGSRSIFASFLHPAKQKGRIMR